MKVFSSGFFSVLLVQTYPFIDDLAMINGNLDKNRNSVNIVSLFQQCRRIEEQISKALTTREIVLKNSYSTLYINSSLFTQNVNKINTP